MIPKVENIRKTASPACMSTNESSYVYINNRYYKTSLEKFNDHYFNNVKYLNKYLYVNKLFRSNFPEIYLLQIV